jgi:hypothetical protein
MFSPTSNYPFSDRAYKVVRFSEKKKKKVNVTQDVTINPTKAPNKCNSPKASTHSTTVCKEKVKMLVTVNATRAQAETCGTATLIHCTSALDGMVSFTPWLN